jgi:tRNA G18 (ribose-2'-O)-methylase SpoU
MFRTADAGGVEKMYLAGITPTPIDRFTKARPEMAKVALGAEQWIPWDASARSLGKTVKLLKKLKDEGFVVYAVEQTKSALPYYSMGKEGSFPPNVVLVVGNEVRGLPASILKAADHVLEIPMYGKKESLNVSVAFGIVLFGLRQ